MSKQYVTLREFSKVKSIEYTVASIRILNLILVQNLTIRDLSSIIEMSEPYISQYVTQLELYGFVSKSKMGKATIVMVAQDAIEMLKTDLADSFYLPEIVADKHRLTDLKNKGELLVD